MEIEYSGEDYQKEIPSPKQAKLLSKTKLGKKTVLNPNKKEIKEENNIINQEDEVENDALNKEIIIIKNDIPNINGQKENKATFLIKTIIKAFYLSTWKRKIKSMKYLSRGYNPRRLNFRKFINSISSVIKQHKYEYLYEILSTMVNLPMPNNVEHDCNYGTLKIVDREILSKKCSNKIVIWAENNYSNKIKDIKNYLMEAFIKIKETNELIGQINQNRETDYSNYEKYNPNSDVIDKKNDQNIIEYKTDDSRENNEFNYNKENVDININNSDENINTNNDKRYMNEKYFNDYNSNNKNNILPENHNQHYYRNYYNINYNNEIIDVDEPKRINEKDEYEINNNYLDDNYDYVEEENNNIYNMNNNYYIQNIGNINDNYSEKINNNNYIEENNFSDNNNYINDNKHIQNINTNNYVEEKNFVEDNKYIGNNYNNINENNYFINQSIDLKENDYNNNDFIENEHTESEFNFENNYKYNDDKEYDYNNNDYIENKNQYQYKEEDNYGEDKYLGNNYFKEDEYDNNYAINNYNKNNLIIPFEEENNNYNNINIPYEVENNNNNFKILYDEDNNNYNNYEIQEYNKNIYDNYRIQNQYNLNNYEYEDNYNNYSNEEYDNDYNNEEYAYEEDEDYYYEEPNQQNINKGVTYYLPYNSQNQSGFRYITREGNNVLISDVYTKPKATNDRSKISIYNFNNSGRNKEYNYINYQYKVQNIGSNSSYSVKKHKRPFPTRDDNHSFYISK